MTRLKEIVLNAEFNNKAGGSYQFHENFPARYIADLTKRPKLKRKLKAVVACGNGTAGAFAPQVMEAIGCEVIPLDTELDSYVSEIQSEPRRHGDAARDPRRGAHAQGRCRLRLRRRRRPLRRGRQHR
jgi:phosphomannomutase/phosphoglucomutase